MKLVSRVLTLLGLAVLVFTGALAFAAREFPVTLLSQPSQAEEIVHTLVDALNRGDLSQASLVLYGQPTLEKTPDFDNPFLTTVWDRYLESMTCQIEDGCYATDSGLYQVLSVEALDIQAALPKVEQRYRSLLSELSQSEDADRVYNDDGTYREDFVLSVLDQAARETLSQDCATTSRNVTLDLVYRDSRWWVLPQEGLMDILCGGFAGKEG